MYLNEYFDEWKDEYDYANEYSNFRRRVVYRGNMAIAIRRNLANRVRHQKIKHFLI